MISIVVALRYGGDAPSADALAAEIRAAIDRAAALGARLVGVGAEGVSFAVDDAAVDDAVELGLAFADDDARFRVGIAIGELAAIRDEDPFQRLSVGPAAQRAFALARAANAGEILVDAAIPEVSAGSLLATGRRVASLEGAGEGRGKRVRAIVLDKDEPFRRAGEASIAHIHDPRVVGREAILAMIESVEPGGVAIVRAPGGAGGTRFLEEIAARAARALVVEPAMCSVEPLGALRLAFDRARGSRPRDLAPREADLLSTLEGGRGIDVVEASDLIRGWLGSSSADPGATVDERAWVLVDDATLVDRASLEAIGHAASVPGVPFAVVARLDVGDVLPAALAGLVVEADVSLKPLQPHEATAVVEEACGGKAAVSPEVVKRWVRRGSGVPLAILEGLRHGLSVGELAVRDGLGGSQIVARSKASGRGRALSPHAWITRRLAVLASDRPADALVVSTVAIAGAGVRRDVIEEAVVDLGLPSSAASEASIERLVRDALIVRRGQGLSLSSRTLREAAIERLDDGARRRIHAALAGAIARIAKGLDLAEGGHHAALAGDHLGAAALSMRAADRARIAGLDELANALAAFARAEGAGPAPMPTTPSPPPKPSVRSPAPPPVASRPPASAVSLPPDALEDALEEDHAPALTIRTPPPAVAPREASARPTLGVENLRTAQIAALPAPHAPPRDLFMGLGPKRSEPAEVSFDTSVPFEPPSAFKIEAVPGAPAPFADREGARRREGLSELGEAARKALAQNDLVALEAALAAIEVVGGSSAAITRVRGIAALAQGRVSEGTDLVRRSLQRARDEGERARSALALAIALGVSGERDAAITTAIEALASERAREAHGLGESACRRIVERLASA